MRKTAVVIGAGPGGGAAAIRLRQRGVANVVLVDKDELPREKTCGSALSPNALEVIEQLGIAPEVKRRGYGIRSLVITTPGGRTMQLETEQAAIVLLRKHFDQLLVEEAVKLGAELRTGWKATGLVYERGRVVGVKSKSEELRADYVLCADGAHSIFSWDPRPKQTISTLMGWWEGFDFSPHTMEMVFDKNLAPLYGWMFPESRERVNIGICIDGDTDRNVRDVFSQFLDDHFRERLRAARQVGKWKGHPISYTTWIRDCTAPGVLYLGEGARITHNATGEGIYQAMRSGIYAADALADVVHGAVSEKRAWALYEWRLRRRFTLGFLVGHALRGALETPLLDWLAVGYNSPVLRKLATRTLGSALAGSRLDEAAAAAPSPSFTTNGAARPRAAAPLAAH